MSIVFPSHCILHFNGVIESWSEIIYEEFFYLVCTTIGILSLVEKSCKFWISSRFPVQRSIRRCECILTPSGFPWKAYFDRSLMRGFIQSVSIHWFYHVHSTFDISPGGYCDLNSLPALSIGTDEWRLIWDNSTNAFEIILIDERSLS